MSSVLHCMRAWLPGPIAQDMVDVLPHTTPVSRTKTYCNIIWQIPCIKGSEYIYVIIIVATSLITWEFMSESDAT
jgi:hypothetical protein